MVKRKPERKPVRRKPAKRKSSKEPTPPEPSEIIPAPPDIGQGIYWDKGNIWIDPPLKKRPRPQKEGRRLNYQDNKAYKKFIHQDELFGGYFGSAFPDSFPAWRLPYWVKDRPYQINRKPYRDRPPRKKGNI